MNELADLSRRRRTLLWLAVLSGLLLAMLDQTIVGTALPQIVRDLGGESWYVWGITAYLVPATVLLPVFARLSDRYGRQRMLLVGMSLFVLGSALLRDRAVDGAGGDVPGGAGSRRGRARGALVPAGRRAVRDRAATPRPKPCSPASWPSASSPDR